MFRFKNLKVRNKLLMSFTIVILFSAAAGMYIILGMNAVNKSYEQAMELTRQRVSYIFAAEDHFSRARMIMRDISQPENTKEDLSRLSAELDFRLDELTKSLNSLYPVAAPAVQEKVASILPQVEKYRADSGEAIGVLMSAGEVSQQNAAYLEALTTSGKMAQDMAASYTDDLSVAIDSLSGMAVSTMRNLASENNSDAQRVMYISLVLFAFIASCSCAIAFWMPNLIKRREPAKNQTGAFSEVAQKT